MSERDDERLLADPIFHEAPQEEEQALVQQLLSSHGAEKLAAAFLRLYRTNHSAPEDLMEVSVYEDRSRKRRDNAAPYEPAQKGPREDFGPGVWFSVSVGRKQNAEPRWLIPMLCRNGNVTKREIGAIKMQPEETYVEIAAASAESFQQALGPNKALERGIRVTRLSGTPDFSRAPSPKPYAGRASRDEQPGETFRDERPKNKFGNGSSGGYAAAAENGGGERRDAKPWSKKAGKPGYNGAKSDKPRYDKPKFEGGKHEGKSGAGPKGKFSKKKSG